MLVKDLIFNVSLGTEKNHVNLIDGFSADIQTKLA